MTKIIKAASVARIVLIIIALACAAGLVTYLLLNRQPDRDSDIAASASPLQEIMNNGLPAENIFRIKRRVKEGSGLNLSKTVNPQGDINVSFDAGEATHTLKFVGDSFEVSVIPYQGNPERELIITDHGSSGEGKCQVVYVERTSNQEKVRVDQSMPQSQCNLEYYYLLQRISLYLGVPWTEVRG